ncbi:hypothetical protein H5V45_07965 [Nocardioides sp. KIGAM211]|uniref:ARB-07466-like C-terminal domain-containing protein n=1 Tax=Nocardioides luti TaxID=2761101 RepID=A0A7X0VAE3_9ACTN|nr:hypothetical protein [Nocardioides luti]MBB6627255.1 hypothetical protein [Nocardioides luti]
MRPFVPRLLAPVLLVPVVVLALLSPSAASAAPLEDYAGYQPQTHCHPKAKPGTTYLGHWLVQHFGGGFGGISRPCSSGGTSEHKEGRAFDWTLDASSKADRKKAKAFLDWAFADDEAGNHDVKARRMGIMYVIWNDHMYPAWHEFEREAYLSSSCKSRKKCSKVLRHRTHLHVSLTRKAAKGGTSWYAGKVDQD